MKRLMLIGNILPKPARTILNALLPFPFNLGEITNFGLAEEVSDGYISYNQHEYEKYKQDAINAGIDRDKVDEIWRETWKVYEKYKSENEFYRVQIPVGLLGNDPEKRFGASHRPDTPITKESVLEGKPLPKHITPEIKFMRDNIYDDEIPRFKYLKNKAIKKGKTPDLQAIVDKIESERDELEDSLPDRLDLKKEILSKRLEERLFPTLPDTLEMKKLRINRLLGRSFALMHPDQLFFEIDGLRILHKTRPTDKGLELADGGEWKGIYGNEFLTDWEYWDYLAAESNMQGDWLLQSPNYYVSPMGLVYYGHEAWFLHVRDNTPKKQKSISQETLDPRLLLKDGFIMALTDTQMKTVDNAAEQSMQRLKETAERFITTTRDVLKTQSLNNRANDRKKFFIIQLRPYWNTWTRYERMDFAKNQIEGNTGNILHNVQHNLDRFVEYAKPFYQFHLVQTVTDVKKILPERMMTDFINAFTTGQLEGLAKIFEANPEEFSFGIIFKKFLQDQYPDKPADYQFSIIDLPYEIGFPHGAKHTSRHALKGILDDLLKGNIPKAHVHTGENTETIGAYYDIFKDGKQVEPKETLHPPEFEILELAIIKILLDESREIFPKHEEIMINDIKHAAHHLALAQVDALKAAYLDIVASGLALNAKMAEQNLLGIDFKDIKQLTQFIADFNINLNQLTKPDQVLTYATIVLADGQFKASLQSTQQLLDTRHQFVAGKIDALPDTVDLLYLHAAAEAPLTSDMFKKPEDYDKYLATMQKSWSAIQSNSNIPQITKDSLLPIVNKFNERLQEAIKPENINENTYPLAAQYALMQNPELIKMFVGQAEDIAKNVNPALEMDKESLAKMQRVRSLLPDNPSLLEKVNSAFNQTVLDKKIEYIKSQNPAFAKLEKGEEPLSDEETESIEDSDLALELVNQNPLEISGNEAIEKVKQSRQILEEQAKQAETEATGQPEETKTKQEALPALEATETPTPIPIPDIVETIPDLKLPPEYDVVPTINVLPENFKSLDRQEQIRFINEELSLLRNNIWRLSNENKQVVEVANNLIAKANEKFEEYKEYLKRESEKEGTDGIEKATLDYLEYLKKKGEFEAVDRFYKDHEEFLKNRESVETLLEKEKSVRDKTIEGIKEKVDKRQEIFNDYIRRAEARIKELSKLEEDINSLQTAAPSPSPTATSLPLPTATPSPTATALPTPTEKPALVELEEKLKQTFRQKLIDNENERLQEIEDALGTKVEGKISKETINEILRTPAELWPETLMLDAYATVKTYLDAYDNWKDLSHSELLAKQGILYDWLEDNKERATDAYKSLKAEQILPKTYTPVHINEGRYNYMREIKKQRNNVQYVKGRYPEKNPFADEHWSIEPTVENQYLGFTNSSYMMKNWLKQNTPSEDNDLDLANRYFAVTEFIRMAVVFFSRKFLDLSKGLYDEHKDDEEYQKSVSKQTARSERIFKEIEEIRNELEPLLRYSLEELKTIPYEETSDISVEDGASEYTHLLHLIARISFIYRKLENIDSSKKFPMQRLPNWEEIKSTPLKWIMHLDAIIDKRNKKIAQRNEEELRKKGLISEIEGTGKQTKGDYAYLPPELRDRFIEAELQRRRDALNPPKTEYDKLNDRRDLILNQIENNKHYWGKLSPLEKLSNRKLYKELESIESKLYGTPIPEPKPTGKIPLEMFNLPKKHEYVETPLPMPTFSPTATPLPRELKGLKTGYGLLPDVYKYKETMAPQPFPASAPKASPRPPEVLQKEHADAEYKKESNRLLKLKSNWEKADKAEKSRIAKEYKKETNRLLKLKSDYEKEAKKPLPPIPVNKTRMRELEMRPPTATPLYINKKDVGFLGGIRKHTPTPTGRPAKYPLSNEEYIKRQGLATPLPTLAITAEMPERYKQSLEEEAFNKRKALAEQSYREERRRKRAEYDRAYPPDQIATAETMPAGYLPTPTVAPIQTATATPSPLAAATPTATQMLTQIQEVQKQEFTKVVSEVGIEPAPELSARPMTTPMPLQPPKQEEITAGQPLGKPLGQPSVPPKEIPQPQVEDANVQLEELSIEQYMNNMRLIPQHDKTSIARKIQTAMTEDAIKKVIKSQSAIDEVLPEVLAENNNQLFVLNMIKQLVQLNVNKVKQTKHLDVRNVITKTINSIRSIVRDSLKTLELPLAMQDKFEEDLRQEEFTREVQPIEEEKVQFKDKEFLDKKFVEYESIYNMQGFKTSSEEKQRLIGLKKVLERKLNKTGFLEESDFEDVELPIKQEIEKQNPSMTRKAKLMLGKIGVSRHSKNLLAQDQDQDQDQLVFGSIPNILKEEMIRKYRNVEDELSLSSFSNAVIDETLRNYRYKELPLMFQPQADADYGQYAWQDYNESNTIPYLSGKAKEVARARLHQGLYPGKSESDLKSMMGRIKHIKRFEANQNEDLKKRLHKVNFPSQFILGRDQSQPFTEEDLGHYNAAKEVYDEEASRLNSLYQDKVNKYPKFLESLYPAKKWMSDKVIKSENSNRGIYGLFKNVWPKTAERYYKDDVPKNVDRNTFINDVMSRLPSLNIKEIKNPKLQNKFSGVSQRDRQKMLGNRKTFYAPMLNNLYNFVYKPKIF